MGKTYLSDNAENVEWGENEERALTCEAGGLFWYAKNESGAELPGALGSDGPTVPFHDLFADGQSHSRAIFFAPSAQTFERPEDSVHLLLVKPNTLIHDLKFPKTVFAMTAGDGNSRRHILFFKLNGIENQIFEQLPHLNFIRR